MTSTSPLCVRLFGRFRLDARDQPVTGIEAAKVQELFSYLLLHRGYPHHRESLAALLWSDSSTAQSKKYLRQALWELQVGLEAGSQPFHSLFRVEADWVSLNRDANLWLDVAIFEAAFSSVKGTPGEQLDTPRAEALERAIDLYQGHLLEGYFQDWCLFERERLENMYLAMLDKVMAYCEAHRLFEAGIAYGARALRQDRAHERTYQHLMRLYYQVGDRVAALHHYQRCVEALDQELGVKPSARTTGLYKQICLDRPLHTEGVPAHPTVASSLVDMRNRLERLLSVLTDIEHEVANELHAVDQVIRGAVPADPQ